MESKNDGGAAFPCDVHQDDERFQGMALRDYFAAKAMQGLIAQSNGSALDSDVSLGAEYAYQMADAMLKARGSV
jgi:hypothetical protein